MLAGGAGFFILSLMVSGTVHASHTPSSTTMTAAASSAGELPSLTFFRRHQMQAQSILLKDLSTGRTLYEVRANRRVAPASLTKIMSALVILEYGQLRDTVTISRKAARARKQLRIVRSRRSSPKATSASS